MATGNAAGMRVLLMSTGNGIGGEESFTTNLAESLMQRGCDVRVAAMGPPHIEELKRRGIAVVSLPIAGRGPMGLLAGARALAKYAAAEGIGVLHAQCAGPAIMSILARRLGMFAKPRPAIMWHDHGLQQGSYKWLAKVFNHLDMSIANSDFELDKLTANGLKPGKIVRIHNGIDMSKLDVSSQERASRRAKIRKEFGLDDATPVAGFIGRLSPEKAPDDFVKSFALARTLMPDMRYVLVGDGPMRPQLEQLRKEMDAEDRIIMTGFRKDVPDILCAIDVLALVSHMETFSLTTLEAMAMHLPCVVTRTGGSPEQVTDGENGRVVPDASPDAIAKALADVLSNADRRTAMGEAGFKRVKTYLNRDRMVSEIENIYRSLL